MTTKDNGPSDDPVEFDEDLSPEMERLRETVRTSKVAQEKLKRIIVEVLAEQGITRPEDLQEDGEQE